MLLPEFVSYLPPERRARVGLPIVCAILLAVVPLRWFDVEPWSVLAILSAALLFCLAGMMWWVQRVGERVTRIEHQRRFAEDVLAAPFWRLAAPQLIGLWPTVLLPTLLFSDLHNSHTWTRATWLALIMAPVALAFTVWAVHWERRRAAKWLERQRSAPNA